MSAHNGQSDSEPRVIFKRTGGDSGKLTALLDWDLDTVLIEVTDDEGTAVCGLPIERARRLAGAILHKTGPWRKP